MEHTFFCTRDFLTKHFWYHIVHRYSTGILIPSAVFLYPLMTKMKFAILAAGEGSRLQSEGVACAKPLVPIHHETMLGRLLRIFHKHQATEICVIINEKQAETETFLLQMMEQHPDWHIRLVKKNTPSSMHSLAALAPYLSDAPFCLTTVDTIFEEQAFANYLAACQAFFAQGGDALMGVTDFIDDETPLYVLTDHTAQVLGFYDHAVPASTYVSGGVYAFSPLCWNTLNRCLQQGISRMRNFQRALLQDGRQVKAHFLGKVLDVDHAGDISKAEDFLKSTSHSL